MATAEEPRMLENQDEPLMVPVTALQMQPGLQQTVEEEDAVTAPGSPTAGEDSGNGTELRSAQDEDECVQTEQADGEQNQTEQAAGKENKTEQAAGKENKTEPVQTKHIGSFLQLEADEDLFCDECEDHFGDVPEDKAVLNAVAKSLLHTIENPQEPPQDPRKRKQTQGDKSPKKMARQNTVAPKMVSVCFCTHEFFVLTLTQIETAVGCAVMLLWMIFFAIAPVVVWSKVPDATQDAEAEQIAIAVMQRFAMLKAAGVHNYSLSV